MNEREKDKLILVGNNIYLRHMQPSDANEAYYRWMNDEEVNRFLESRFSVHTLENLRDYIASRRQSNNELFMAIVRKSDERHIGNIKLGPINEIHRFADIGIIVGEKDCWGKGCATEAIKLITDYSFRVLMLNKLTAGCYSSNRGSARAFEKAGFVSEGIRKSQYLCDNNYVDDWLYGMINCRKNND